MGAIPIGTIFTLLVITAAEQAHQCGQRQVSTQKLIFNGYKASAGAWPWHGALFHRRKLATVGYVCGVTILTEKFVLTAAHCTFDPLKGGELLPAGRAFVKVGLTDLNKPEHHVQYHDVASIIRHEEYDDGTGENDIALLKLNTDIGYDDYVQPICLWQGNTDLKNVVSQIGYTVGWGYDQNYGLPEYLNEATMPIVSMEECMASDPNYFREFYFQGKTFCASYRNGTTDANGDSGGGLYLRQENIWVLRGIVSSAKSDPNTLQVDPKSFVMFVDASYYLDWMKDYMTGVQSNSTLS